ncbi:MAG: FAD-dependent oxidoreductase [Bacteroidota bacterium]
MDKKDILIIGGGLAGVTAAVEALDNGLSVRLLDRGKAERFGGLANWAFGGIFYVDSPFQRKNGFQDSPELAFNDWCSAAEFGPEDHLPKKWAEQFVSRTTAEVYEWLKPRNIKYIPSVQWAERGIAKQGNSVPRFHLVWGSGKQLVQTLIRNLREHPMSHLLDIHFEHKVEDLQTTNDQITGVSGTDLSTGKVFLYEAAVTVLAAGGITGSVEKVKEHWHPDFGTPPAHMLTGSHLVADGQIHGVASKAGAQITHLQHQWNYAGGVHHPKGDHEFHGLSLVPPKTAVWVNYKGKTIGPNPMVTGFDTRNLVEQISKQEKKYSWQVTNYKIAKKELGVSGSTYNHALREMNKWGFAKTILFGNKGLLNEMIETCKDFVVATNLDELVVKMNALTGTQDMDVNTLKKSIHQFDEMMLVGKDSQDPYIRMLEKLRENKGDRFRLANYGPIQNPGGMPFVAMREFILTRKSMGGLQTNLESQVLDQEGKVMDGLYAVGEVAGFGGGGIHGKRALEGTFLGNCIFNARVAIQSILGKGVKNEGSPVAQKA